MHRSAVISLLLAGLLILTGIGAASARGHMAADGVICGSGSFTVVLAADGLPLFDGEGEPVEAQALPCLDCTFSGWVAAPAPHAPMGPATFARLAPQTAQGVLSAKLWKMGGMGRSPPRAT